ncbi:MAG: DUF4293 domain-containing protein [Tannerella sp.]|jgi:hypothetical protein|nr:DUF4293 domain-containing protein [Tannerella sp.]
MIQRIQTVYLLIVAALFVALVFLPMASLQSGDGVYSFDVTGLNVETVDDAGTSSFALEYSTWALFALASIVALLSFTVIFMYKKRMLQIRLCIFNSLIIIGFCLLTAYYLWKFSGSGLGITPDIWTSFPLIALILNYLAIRNIGADETLVRSLERLR